jgi:hypothetical protein
VCVCVCVCVCVRTYGRTCVRACVRVTVTDCECVHLSVFYLCLCLLSCVLYSIRRILLILTSFIDMFDPPPTDTGQTTFPNWIKSASSCTSARGSAFDPSQASCRRVTFSLDLRLGSFTPPSASILVHPSRFVCPTTSHTFPAVVMCHTRMVFHSDRSMRCFYIHARPLTFSF